MRLAVLRLLLAVLRLLLAVLRLLRQWLSIFGGHLLRFGGGLPVAGLLTRLFPTGVGRVLGLRSGRSRIACLLRRHVPVLRSFRHAAFRGIRAKKLRQTEHGTSLLYKQNHIKEHFIREARQTAQSRIFCSFLLYHQSK